MNKSKKQLLYSIIFMIIYLVFNFIYLSKGNGLISKNNTQNIENVSILLLSIIGIIYYMILLLKKNIDLNRHSKGILIFSIIFFIFNIISGIFGFMVYSKLDNKSIKRELPSIELDNYNNRWICLLSFIFCMILMFFVPNYIENKNYIWGIYVIIFTTMVLIFRKQLIHDFKIFKEYFREYNSLVLKTWLKSLILVSIINIIVQIITNSENSTNQQNIQTMFDNIPIFVVILTMIYAPIVEELLFRGVFRKFLNNKYMFIFISGFSFGLLHVIDDYQNLSELLYVLSYGTLGCFLASLYYKTNNICTNIYFHFLQNTLSVIGMLILKFM